MNRRWNEWSWVLKCQVELPQQKVKHWRNAIGEISRAKLPSFASVGLQVGVIKERQSNRWIQLTGVTEVSNGSMHLMGYPRGAQVHSMALIDIGTESKTLENGYSEEDAKQCCWYGKWWFGHAVDTENLNLKYMHLEGYFHYFGYTMTGVLITFKVESYKPLKG